ncbi:MAG: helix-hairpin-helix domain-containing protein [Gemmatimonadota bacterium]|nr:helix-hairpin-helix domain-containing protein [Gemmatimonadota bacterium]
MNRFTALPTLISLSAVVALMACSSDSNKAADTTVAVADTAMAPAAPASTTPSASSTDASGAAIVPININTATDAEILRIPGVGQRMLREFKEYRPYTSIEQFRREIGKYVDKAEVTRLEKYIVIK